MRSESNEEPSVEKPIQNEGRIASMLNNSNSIDAPKLRGSNSEPKLHCGDTESSSDEDSEYMGARVIGFDTSTRFFQGYHSDISTIDCYGYTSYPKLSNTTIENKP